MREVAEVVEAEEARQGEETPTTAVKVVGPVEGLEVVVGDEPWDRSIPRLWMGPVTSTISSDRKRGHVPTDSTAPCVTLRLPNLPEAHHQHNNETVTSLLEIFTIIFTKMTKYRYLFITQTKLKCLLLHPSSGVILASYLNKKNSKERLGWR